MHGVSAWDMYGVYVLLVMVLVLMAGVILFVRSGRKNLPENREVVRNARLAAEKLEPTLYVESSEDPYPLMAEGLEHSMQAMTDPTGTIY